MHSPNLLNSVYQTHHGNVHRMAETLLLAGVPQVDVELLRLLPWPYLANRIAVERECLSRKPVCHAPPGAWTVPPDHGFTPAQMEMVKLFDLALSDEEGDDVSDGKELVLPA